MARTYNELDELLRKEKKKNTEQGAKIEILENDVEYLEQSKVDVWTVDDIQNIDPDILDALHCGDVVRKATDNQRHSYVVSYKEDGVGICLTYADASIVETVSYDKSGDTWVYNSKDLSHLPTDADQQSWSEKSNVEANPILAGTEEVLESVEIDNVKYKIGGGGKIYRHTIELSQSGSDIHFVLDTTIQTAFNLETLKAYLEEKYPSANSNKVCTGTIIQNGYVYGFILSYIGGTTKKMQYKGGNITSWTDFTGSLYRDDVAEL